MLCYNMKVTDGIDEDLRKPDDTVALETYVSVAMPARKPE